MALCPFAKHKLIAPGSSDPRISARVAILHVDAGGAASLFDFFKNRSGGIESHFHVPWLGKIEQYRDTDWQADANHLANDFAISIESQGFGGGKWTKGQLKKIKKLLLWLHEVEGIPLEKIKVWNGSGVGYHVQFGAPGPWTPVSKSCPGPERIKQFHDVLVPWMTEVTRPKTTVRLVAANMRHDRQGFKARIEELKKLNADVMFLSECFNLHDELRKAFPAAKIVHDDSTRSKSDTVLIVRRPKTGPFEVTDFGFKQLSKDTKAPKRIGQDRYVAWAKVKFRKSGKKFLLCSIHLNAAVQESDGTAKSLKLKRVFEYRESIRNLRKVLGNHKGAEPVIGGDVNWRRTGKFMEVLFSPDRMFKARKLRVFAHGLDRIAFPQVMKPVKAETFMATNADHHWLIQDVEL